MTEKEAIENFKRKATNLKNALMEFEHAYSDLEIYTNVETGQEPFTDLSNVFSNSLDESSANFMEIEESFYKLKEFQ